MHVLDDRAIADDDSESDDTDPLWPPQFPESTNYDYWSVEQHRASTDNGNDGRTVHICRVLKLCLQHLRHRCEEVRAKCSCYYL